MTSNEVQAEVAVIRERARRGYRRFVVIMFVVLVGGTTALDAIESRSDLLGEALARSIGAAVGLGSVFLISRRRRAGVFAPQLTSGLPWRQRRHVNRDLRRGRPSSDPVLVEVERLTAERLTNIVAAGLWILPILAVLGCSMFLVVDNATDATLTALFVVAVVGALIDQVRLHRGLRAFGR